MERETFSKTLNKFASVKFGSNCEVQGWTNAAMPGRHRAAYGYCSGNPVNMVDPTGLFDFSGLFDAISIFFTGSSSIDSNNATYDSYQVASNYQVPYSEDVSYTWGNYLDPGTPVDNSGMETASRTIDPRDPSSYQNQRDHIGTEKTYFCNYTTLWNAYRMAYYLDNDIWLDSDQANEALTAATAPGGGVRNGYTSYIPVFDTFNSTFHTTYEYSFKDHYGEGLPTTAPDDYHFEIADGVLSLPYIWMEEAGWTHNVPYLGMIEGYNKPQVMNIWTPRLQDLGPMVTPDNYIGNDGWSELGGNWGTNGGYRYGVHRIKYK